MTALPEFLLAPLLGNRDDGTPRSPRWPSTCPQEDDTQRDARLLTAMRQGSEPAFAELFDTYWPLLNAFAERIVRSSDVARDVVQDVMIRLWDARDTVDIRTSVRAYLYSAVRNRASHHLQHNRVVHQTETFFTALGASPGMGTNDTPEDLMARRELASILDRTISMLPPRTRQVALLKWNDGLSRTEIAHVMGNSPSTVDKQLGVAVRAVRAALDTFLENSSPRNSKA